MKLLTTLFLFILLPLNVPAQNITNTLGASGIFTIKDASINYFTLTQSTGQVNIPYTLRLENTTSSTTGVIYKGTDRFLHNYKPASNNGYNTFLGINAGNFTMSSVIFYQASSNTGIGYHSLTSLTMGYANTAVGNYSLYSNTTSGANTAVGNYSLNSNTTGNYNTALGYSAGSNVTTGSNLTLIGFNAQPTSGSATNEITLGDSFVGLLRAAVTTITSLSDARDKKNITDLPLGLDFISKLKPRQFNWDKREWYDDNKSDGSKMQEASTAGFIAQELDEVQTINKAEWLNLVLKNNPDKLEATPGNLLPVMVKAIQELMEENDRLKEEFARLEQLVAELKANANNDNSVSLTDTN